MHAFPRGQEEKGDKFEQMHFPLSLAGQGRWIQVIGHVEEVVAIANNRWVVIATFIAGVILSSYVTTKCTSKEIAITRGFLRDYAKLKPLPEDPKVLYYERPNVNWKKYTKLLLDPIMVYYSPAAKDQHIHPDELKKLTDYFRNAVIEAVKDAYPVVDKPGRGVLRIRAAITDVIPTNPFVNIVTVATSLTPVDIGGAAIEAEFLDSLTNERLMAIVDRKKATPLDLVEGFTKWGHAEAAFKAWATELREALDEAHGKN